MNTGVRTEDNKMGEKTALFYYCTAESITLYWEKLETEKGPCDSKSGRCMREKSATGISGRNISDWSDPPAQRYGTVFRKRSCTERNRLPGGL